ncbi:unnamed protein product [Adineta ricciae]|uniref:Uncharacterized protein n=1 Tax=Adineta ricciae TaxID=249248 RepID=A0A815D4R9_ADIRI|nr:unnamed protein product [Adineta ricciae]
MLTGLLHLWRKLWLTIKNYNLFPSIPPTQDQHQLRNQRLSTRLFIVLLILSLIVLILYTSLITITQTLKFTSPSITQYRQLYSTYSQTLSCDCKQISINYHTFLHLNYTLHQVCDSIFVTQDWFDYLTLARPQTILYADDFLVSGTYLFQGMRAFCDLSRQTIENRLTEFYATQYVSADVVPDELFQLQAESLISQFISSTINNFLLSLSSIRQTTQSNILFSARQTNYELGVYQNVVVYSIPYSYSGCSCASSAKCAYQCRMYNGFHPTVLFYVPGMYIGCYPVESLLQSDLRCWYNQSCISQVQSYFNASAPMNVTALKAAVSEEFVTNSTMEEILGKLMIEEWFPTLMYENYYNACSPSECSYVVEVRNSVVYIVTTVIGVIGGLVTILRLIVPRAVALNLNVFPSIPPTQDQHQLRNQRLSTRLFIVLLIISLIVLILYTSLITITQTLKFTSPSITQYRQLYSTYSQTLSCDCKQISINYHTFLHLNYTLHQVCDSIFVTQDWFDYLTLARPQTILYADDFLVSGTYLFQGMRAFCDLSRQTIENRLTEFYATQYVSADVVPDELFQLQAESLISQFISSTINNFLLSLSSIRQTTQSNILFSARQTNYELGVYQNVVVYSIPYSYSGCSCASSAKCAYQCRMYNGFHPTVLFYVPGMYIGCYPVESLLQSDLRCWYNQSCISQVQSYFNASAPMNVTALKAAVSEEFVTNSTMEEILGKLMIEEWFPTLMYENYYNACSPSECSYVVEVRNSVVYIVTTVIGVIGGLVTILKQAIPLFVELSVFCSRKWRMNYGRNSVLPVV